MSSEEDEVAMSSDDDEGVGARPEAAQILRAKLQQVNEAIVAIPAEQELNAEELAAWEAQQGAIQQNLFEWHHGEVTVVLGTTDLLKAQPDLVSKITTMINTAYFHAIKETLPPSETSYERVDEEDVLQRLAMGDAGIAFANRILLLAYRGGQLCGAVSSTYAPPWTPQGCGHWGLLVVHVEHQNKGVAKALTFAAERRVAGAADEIQIEYDYHVGHEYSDRLKAWYETKCGFTCTDNHRSRGGGEFRKCRKVIPRLEQAIGQWQRLKQIEVYLESELQKVVATQEKPGADSAEDVD